MSVPHRIDWFEDAQSFDELSKRLSTLAANIDDNFAAVEDQADTDRGNQVTLGDDLTALKNLTGTGIVVRTADGTFAVRELQAGTDITITDGDGVSGDPTIESTASGGGSTLPDPVTVAHGGTGATDASTARTNLGVAIGSDVQAYDADLAAVAALSSNGLIARTGAGTVAARTITAGSGIVITDGDGVSGNPVIAASPGSSDTEGAGGSSDAFDFFTDPWLIGQHKTRNSIYFFRDGTTFQTQAISMSNLGTISGSTDARGHWAKTVSAASNGSTAAYRSSQLSMFWIDHEPTILIRLRTGPTIANMRHFAGFWETTTITNADTQTVKCVGFRYSTTASDTGFTPISFDGTTQTVGTTLNTIGAGEEYILAINVYGGGSNAVFYVVRRSDWSVASYDMTLGSGVKGTGMGINGSWVVTLESVAKQIEISRFSCEHGLMS